MKLREADEPGSGRPVVIVGAGPSGISTWLHLHQIAPSLASKALVIDASVFPREKVCAGGLTPVADSVLRRLNIDPEFGYIDINRIEVLLDKKRYSVDYPRIFRVVSRCEFDNALLSVATRRGMQVHLGERVLGARRCETAICVKTDKGEYWTKAVVAADGSRSRIREALMPGGPQGNCRALETLGYSSKDQCNTAIIDFSCLDEGVGGYYWSFPALSRGGGLRSFGLFDSGVNTRILSLGKGFRRFLDEHVDGSIGRWRGDTVRRFEPSCASGSMNVLLAGDSLGVDAFGGEGISYGMLWGRCAARALATAHSNGDFRFRAHAALWRRPRVDLTFRWLLSQLLYSRLSASGRHRLLSSACYYYKVSRLF